MLRLLLLLACVVWAQEIPFSHKTHIALGLRCKECHPAPDPGERMTLPAASKCMACHRTIGADKQAIRALAAYAESKQLVPWKRVYAVAAGVYWSHRTHLDAGLTCETCHGDVPKMDVVKKVKDVTSMTGCMNCHRDRNAGIGCDLCHESR